jgi:hypothetical protein
MNIQEIKIAFSTKKVQLEYPKIMKDQQIEVLLLVKIILIYYSILEVILNLN